MHVEWHSTRMHACTHAHTTFETRLRKDEQTTTHSGAAHLYVQIQGGCGAGEEARREALHHVRAAGRLHGAQQPTNQPTSHSIVQPTNHPISQPVDQSINQYSTPVGCTGGRQRSQRCQQVSPFSQGRAGPGASGAGLGATSTFIFLLISVPGPSAAGKGRRALRPVERTVSDSMPGSMTTSSHRP